EGRLWGLVIAGTNSDEPLQPDAEERLAGFTELVATAIANAQAQGDLTSLAEQQASLRRVATLVAEGVPPQQLFALVAEEVAEVVDAPSVLLIRYEPEGFAYIVASVNDDAFPVGSRWPLDGPSATARALETGRSARIDDWAELAGTIADRTR